MRRFSAGDIYVWVAHESIPDFNGTATFKNVYPDGASVI